ncbi:MAG: hypothetical protein EOP32_39010 [Rhodococcus sp. (in: high G+C Gram-positive bacteria)]|nr:MAG: hypothetical protein EOP32_39010 [Rhodococcus sp. (in: high G+C Gram-positive bacteria)]
MIGTKSAASRHRCVCPARTAATECNAGSGTRRDNTYARTRRGIDASFDVERGQAIGNAQSDRCPGFRGVALQELLDRYDVPSADPDGQIREQ